MSFERNIFINCPFDNDYYSLLKAVIFTIIYLGYEPKISETSDSGVNRLNTIKDLIEQSKFSIHDISRVELNRDHLPRFNMPLECGIDFGAKLIGPEPLNTKVFLILESHKYRYQKFMSDVAGNDIRAHNNEPELVIKAVRDWLKIYTNRPRIDHYKRIWNLFNEFLFDFKTFSIENEFNPDNIFDITFSDLIELMKEWIEGFKERSNR